MLIRMRWAGISVKQVFVISIFPYLLDTSDRILPLFIMSFILYIFLLLIAQIDA